MPCLDAIRAIAQLIYYPFLVTVFLIVDTATFNKHFGQYGEITDSVIMKDRFTGQPRGFGFITYADPSVVDKVIEDEHILNGKQVKAALLSCWLVISFCHFVVQSTSPRFLQFPYWLLHFIKMYSVL